MPFSRYLLSLGLLFTVAGASAREQGRCDLVLKEMSAVERPTYQHPDVLTVENFLSLRPGDIIVVEPYVFGWKSKIGNKLGGPTEVTVKEVKVLKPGQWGDRSTIIYVTHPAFGTVGLRDFRVHDHAYRRTDYATRSPFQENDLVQIGGENFNILDKKLVVAGEPDNSLTIPKEFLPYFGRYLGVHDADHYLVEVMYIADPKAKDRTIMVGKLMVPRSDVQALPTGRRDVARERLAKLNGIKLTFSPGERVQFREGNGLVNDGVILEMQGDRIKIQLAHETTTVPLGWLARVDGPGRATTRRFRPSPEVFATTQWTDMERPQRLLADVLNGGAKLASLPDFKFKTPMEKLELLHSYLQLFQPGRNVAKTAEIGNKDNFDTLLCAGAGVCRHNSMLAATLFSELGYPTRMMISSSRTPQTERHAWVEVDMADVKGKKQTFVVDPTYGKVYSMAEVTRLAGEDPKSHSFHYYTNKQRLIAEDFPFGE